jgi:hypothetical protein
MEYFRILYGKRCKVGIGYSEISAGVQNTDFESYNLPPFSKTDAARANVTIYLYPYHSVGGFTKCC